MTCATLMAPEPAEFAGEIVPGRFVFWGREALALHCEIEAEIRGTWRESMDDLVWTCRHIDLARGLRLPGTVKVIAMVQA
jgi:hypothetical protein